jgi:hypothetical protein
MKKQPYLLLLIVMFLVQPCFSQIPNYGFENWTSAGNCMEASDWYSTNLFDTMSSFCPISRSTDHFPATIGNYSVRVENNAALLPSFHAYGIIASAQLDGTDKPLFPVSGHPNSLTGYYKFNCVNGDTMSINVHLSYQGTELAMGELAVHNTVSNWTSFNIPISSYVSADSARITIMACNIEGAGIQGGSVLFVDNLNFDTLLSEVPIIQDTKNALQVIPNPAWEKVYVSLESGNDQIARVEVIDVAGRVIRNTKPNYPGSFLPLSISDFDEGIYFLRVHTMLSSIFLQKLIVDR